MSAISNKQSGFTIPTALSTDEEVFPVRLLVNHDVSRSSFDEQDLIIEGGRLSADLVNRSFKSNKNQREFKLIFATLIALGVYFDQCNVFSEFQYLPVLALLSFFILFTKIVVRKQSLPRALEHIYENYQKNNSERKEYYELMILNRKEIQSLKSKLRGWEGCKTWIGALERMMYINKNIFLPNDFCIYPDIKLKLVDGKYEIQPETRIRNFHIIKTPELGDIGYQYRFPYNLNAQQLFVTELGKNFNFKEIEGIENVLNELLPSFLAFLQSAASESKEEMTANAEQEKPFTGIFTDHGFTRESVPAKREKPEPAKHAKVKTRPISKGALSEAKSTPANVDKAKNQLAKIQFLGNSKDFLKSSIVGHFEDKLSQAKISFNEAGQLERMGKFLGEGVYELKSSSEDRLYITYDIKDENGKEQITVLGFSHTKSSQSEQIKNAKRLLRDLQEANSKGKSKKS